MGRCLEYSIVPLSLLKNQLLREEMKKDKYQIKDYSKIS